MFQKNVLPPSILMKEDNILPQNIGNDLSDWKSSQIQAAIIFSHSSENLKFDSDSILNLWIIELLPSYNFVYAHLTPTNVTDAYEK
jgi:hypothetical protein